MYHILAFLFVITNSGSLGVTLPESTQRNGSLSALLSSLARSCPNAFLKEQIEGQIKTCDVPVSSYSKQQYACLMFFDISKQLCGSNLTLLENSSTKINEYLDVENVCIQAKSWSVTDLKPGFKDKVEGLLRNNKSCIKICEVEDIASQDTNFFCKYFKWGSEVLSSDISSNKDVVQSKPNAMASQGTSGQTISNSVSQVVPEPHQDVKVASGVDNSIHMPDTLNVSDKLNVIVASSEPRASPKAIVNQNPDDSLSDIEIPKPSEDLLKAGQEVSKPSEFPMKVAQEPANTGQLSSNPGQESVKPGEISIEPATELEKPDKTAKASQNPLLVELPDNPLKTASLTPDNDGISGVQQSPQSHEENQMKSNEEGAGKPPQMDLDQTDEYQDTNDNPGGAMDELEEQGRPEGDLQPELHPISVTSNKNSLSSEERELYQTAMVEDDHFFPFFLTGVIMVVLLYVLYHNKSKVSKVVLGLLVEGRQPGRRRNSRGHAYKRLDTLEQAMSTSSTAPPSKIIY